MTTYYIGRVANWAEVICHVNKDGDIEVSLLDHPGPKLFPLEWNKIPTLQFCYGDLCRTLKIIPHVWEHARNY